MRNRVSQPDLNRGKKETVIYQLFRLQGVFGDENRLSSNKLPLKICCNPSLELAALQRMFYRQKYLKNI